jgi:glycosyltransferase involved in cell wall biosynthesis
VPGKLFEYLAAGKTVLALCGEGEVRRTVTSLGAGLCAPPDDPDGIETALRQLWQGHRSGSLPRVQGGLERFHRRELTRQLAVCFDEVLAP